MTMTASRMTVRKLAQFELTTAHADALATFFERAFGFRRLAEQRLSGTPFEELHHAENSAKRITVGLGDETVGLLQFDRPGDPYPADAVASSLVFQHFAIVVANMEQAYQRLSTVDGWRAISRGGPQQLPKSSGGVVAFKFRDPEGHPLELLAFPEGRAPARWKACAKSALCLGIDHSAICVSDTARSVAFYEGLGFQVSSRSVNRGPEQERLDGVYDPHVEVTALSPIQATPHIELLCYRGAESSHGAATGNNGIAATRLVLEIDSQPSAEPGAAFERGIFDPDGHRLVIVPRGAVDKIDEETRITLKTSDSCGRVRKTGAHP
jgi:catechol 2,3-dioxygenase-like lactoylglutathione lyase family enzyme